MRKTKYFVVSDVHSFYRPLWHALNKAGWGKRTKSHRLVVLGDIFDRGDETLQVYDFIRSIPKDRRILVKGNHEDLFLELLRKRFPQAHDFSNGTVKTFCAIAHYPEKSLDASAVALDYLNGKYGEVDDSDGEAYRHAREFAYNRTLENFAEIKRLVIESGIPEWLQSDEWVDYFELKDYVMVHSFIPIGHDWRTAATDSAWKEARWDCPFRLFDDGCFNEPGKTLVCGHWHAAGFREHYEKTAFDDMDFYYKPEIHAIYKHESDNPECGKAIIAIDACTAISNMVNVLTLEE